MLVDSCVTRRCVHGAWGDAVSQHHCHFGKPQEIGDFLYFSSNVTQNKKKLKKKNHMEPKIEQLKQGQGVSSAESSI